MRNLEEDKQFVVNGNHLPLCETELIAVHAIVRAILAESKLEIAVKALEQIIEIYSLFEDESTGMKTMAQSALEKINKIGATIQEKSVEHCIHGLVGFCINCIDEEDKAEGLR